MKRFVESSAKMSPIDVYLQLGLTEYIHFLGAVMSIIGQCVLLNFVKICIQSNHNPLHFFKAIFLADIVKIEW